MFNPEQTRDEIVSWLKEYAKKTDFDKVVIGISGGKDSTITAALCARALGPENVYGVMLPDGNQKDIADSYKICKDLNIKYTEINIGNIHKALIQQLGFAENGDVFGIHYNREADINVAPRLRMTVLRYITQALGARLVGTGNLSEITVGYFTKDGDQSCDFSLLGKLTSIEVVQIGLTMPEIPVYLVTKTPSDGLCGLSDEEKLGVSYKDIHAFIRDPLSLWKNKHDLFIKINMMNIKSDHKLKPPMTFNPSNSRGI